METFQSHVLLRSCFFIESFFCFPTTVTPFPRFTTLSNAARFCLFTPPILFALANLSTEVFNASRRFFFILRSFPRKERFSVGVSSLRARGSEDEGKKTSSGASIVAADFVVGRADSRVVVETLAMVEITALGCPIFVN